MTQPAQGWHLRATVGKKELVADAERIEFGETAMAVDAIDSVSFWSWARKYGNRRNTCELRAGSDRLEVSFYVYRPERYPQSRESMLWKELVRYVDACVIPRVTKALVSRVAAGESIPFGRLRASEVGLTGRARLLPVSFPWSGLQIVDRGYEHLFIAGTDIQGRNRKVWLHMQYPNVVAIPLLANLMRRQQAR